MKSRSRPQHERQPTAGEIARVRVSAFVIVLMAVLTGCEPTVTGPEPFTPPNALGNPVAGHIAFVQSCAACHSSHDGYDLAAFGFSSFDVFRRSLSHVDSATSLDITAYIETLKPVVSFGSPPFQPGGGVGEGDQKYWSDALGTSGWPTGLTADVLRAINPRSLQVPLAMPEWSLEESAEDWLPDAPLPTEVLDYSGGAIPTRLAAYYSDPTESNLLRVLEPFKAATEGPELLCWQLDPDPCFDARRWMASLGAQHYLRLGAPEAVPVEVAQAWWDVGTSAIALSGVTTDQENYAGFDRVIASIYIIGARWMYLAYSYHPEAFNEPSGYMSTFIQAQELPRVSVLVALRRMVGDGPAHQEHADQFLQDGFLAVRSAMLADSVEGGYENTVGPGVTEFVFDYYVDRLEAGSPAGLDSRAALEMVTLTWNEGERWLAEDSAIRARVIALRERVVELLQ